MKYFLILIISLVVNTSFSQTNLSGRFFYNIQSHYRLGDSNTIEVSVICKYFEDSLMHTIRYTAEENNNYFYYNENFSNEKNIKRAISEFFLLPEIESIEYKTITDNNVIGESVIYGFVDNKVLTDSTAATFFVFENNFYWVFDEKRKRENRNWTVYPNAPLNSFHTVYGFIEFDPTYVRKKIYKTKPNNG